MDFFKFFELELLKFSSQLESPFLNKIEKLLNKATRFEKTNLKNERFLNSAINIGNQTNIILTDILIVL